MKNKVYILIEIFDTTVKRFPHITLRKFKILYDGWRTQGIRKKTRTSTFYTNAWNRGWLSENDANSLRKYIGLS